MKLSTHVNLTTVIIHIAEHAWFIATTDISLRFLVLCWVKHYILISSPPLLLLRSLPKPKAWSAAGQSFGCSDWLIKNRINWESLS